jgi:hypothetical protein
MLSSVFWDTRSSLVKVNRRFRRTYCLLPESRKVNQGTNQQEAVSKLCRFPACLILKHWRWSKYIPSKRQSTFTGLYPVMSQETDLCTVHIIHRIPLCNVVHHIPLCLYCLWKPVISDINLVLWRHNVPMDTTLQKAWHYFLRIVQPFWGFWQLLSSSVRNVTHFYCPIELQWNPMKPTGPWVISIS